MRGHRSPIPWQPGALHRTLGVWIWSKRLSLAPAAMLCWDGSSVWCQCPSQRPRLKRCLHILSFLSPGASLVAANFPSLVLRLQANTVNTHHPFVIIDGANFCDLQPKNLTVACGWAMELNTGFHLSPRGFLGGSDSKESACNAGDGGSIPGLWRSPGEGNGYSSSILSWRIPRTEEPGGLQPMRLQRVGHNWVTNTFVFHLSPGTSFAALSKTLKYSKPQFLSFYKGRISILQSCC